MRQSRAGFAFVAVTAALMMTGCGTKSEPPAAPPAAASPTQPSAKDVLAQAAKKTREASHTVSSVDQEGTLTGLTDPALTANQLTLEMTSEGTKIKIELLTIGSDNLVKITVPSRPTAFPKKWMRYDIAKVKQGAIILVRNAVTAGLESLAVGVTTAEKIGPGAYKGTVDLTVTTSVAADPDVKKAGEKSKAIPFEATVDDAGWVKSVTLKPPFGQNGAEDPLALAYSNFAGKAGIAKPTAADTMAAPANVYTLLGGAK